MDGNKDDNPSYLLYPLEREAQFFLDIKDRFVGFKSVLFSNKYLSVPWLRPSEFQAGWSDTYKREKSKMRFSQTSFTPENAMLQQYLLDDPNHRTGEPENPDPSTSFVIYLNWWKIEGLPYYACLIKDIDGYIRAINTMGRGYFYNPENPDEAFYEAPIGDQEFGTTSATPPSSRKVIEISFVSLGGMHKDLTSARALKKFDAKVSMFESIAFDPDKIRSDDELKLFILEVKNTVALASENLSNWRSLESKKDVIIKIFLELKNRFIQEFLGNAGTSALRTFLIAQLGSTPKANEDPLTLLENAQAMTDYLKYRNIAFQGYFEKLKYSEKVEDLQSRLNSLHEDEDLKIFFNDLEKVILKPRSTENYLFVEAFPEDIDKLSKILSLLDSKDVFLENKGQRENSYDGTSKAYQDRYTQLTKAFSEEIPYSVYLDNLEKSFEVKTFTDEQSELFMKKLHRLASEREKISHNDELIRLIEIINRAMSNQLGDKIDELQGTQRRCRR